MTLRAPAVVPPIVLPDALDRLDAGDAVAQGRGAGGVGADVVALDHVAGCPAADDVNTIARRCPR